MSAKTDLKRSIFQVLKSNRDGSYATQHDRKFMLFKFAEDLFNLGYKLRSVHGLKQKHITAVIEFWKSKNLSASTIKNRTSALRHLCARINKSSVISDNTQLGIQKRVYIPRGNRAIHNPDFSKISNQYVRISLELQRVFGLRREESLKIRPWLADRGEYLYLQQSWRKGGRDRDVPIRTEEQRYWLDQAKKLVKHKEHSLIPQKKSYIRQHNVYDKQVMRAGLKNLHGLRHAYAQQRYKELTGCDAPINGGPQSKQLSEDQKQRDYLARMVLTEELGHSREQITVNYLGRKAMVASMKTLTLQEAANFLKMTPESLRLKAMKGEVPGAKPGKRWVFSQDDLADYLRSLYPSNAKLLQGAIEIDRRKIWHCTREVIRGGLKSARMEEDYNKALNVRQSRCSKVA